MIKRMAIIVVSVIAVVFIVFILLLGTLTYKLSSYFQNKYGIRTITFTRIQDYEPEHSEE